MEPPHPAMEAVEKGYMTEKVSLLGQYFSSGKTTGYLGVKTPDYFDRLSFGKGSGSSPLMRSNPGEMYRSPSKNLFDDEEDKRRRGYETRGNNYSLI
ncbi:MAG: hypothetical protein WCV90_01900 [Candidatus Woesearchaeota archaeon]